MKIKNKLNEGGAITKALLAGTSLAMLSFFSPSAFADSVSSDAEALLEPTLTKLHKLASTDENYSPIDSAYTLTEVDANDITDGAYTGTEKGFLVEKYLDNGDGKYTTKYYLVDVTSQGSGDTVFYCTWVEDDSGNLSLSLSTADESGTSDFSIAYDSETDNLVSTRLQVSNTVDSDYIIEGNYINITKTVSQYTLGTGGAIYTAATISSITGDFINNHIGTGYAGGGAAIYNNGTITNDITGNFIGNYVTMTNNLSDSGGGAILNHTEGTVSAITGNFIGNYVSSDAYASGGAICNNGTITNGITGDFIGNYALATTYFGIGGAVCNNGTIGSIAGDFIGNYTLATSYPALGGAAYNSGTIGDIIGDFTNNYTSASFYSLGGAVYNSGTIGNITSDFVGNYAESTGTSTTYSYAEGGAIYNKGTIGDIVGNISNNHTASDVLSATGGAILNTGDNASINSIEGNITDNYTVGSTSALAGAVYNSGTITFKASDVADDDSITGSSYSYTGNYATTNANGVPSASDDENGGFLYNSGTTTFSTDTNSSISIGTGEAGYDSIAGTGTITKKGAGTLTVNSSMKYFTGSLSVDEGLMEVNNTLGASSISIGTADTYATLSLLINSSNVLSNESLSTITFNNDYSVLKLLSTTVSTTEDKIFAFAANSNFAIDTDDASKVVTYGGTYAGNTFTVAKAETATSDSLAGGTTVNGSSNIVISDTSADTKVTISTSSATTSSETAITISSATDITSDVKSGEDTSAIYSAIVKELDTEVEVLTSWAFTVDIETASDSVVVSFYIGDVDLDTVSLFHTDEVGTTDVTSQILAYEDGTLSFEAYSFSTYTAVTSTAAVPEPSTYAMIIGILALGFAAYRRRK